MCIRASTSLRRQCRHWSRIMAKLPLLSPESIKQRLMICMAYISALLRNPKFVGSLILRSMMLISSDDGLPQAEVRERISGLLRLVPRLRYAGGRNAADMQLRTACSI